jgi:hypothetical protein
LAANAVDNVVLGPGVKLAAVVNTIKAVNSTVVMGGLRVHASDFIVETSTLAVQFLKQFSNLYCQFWQHSLT